MMTKFSVYFQHSFIICILSMITTVSYVISRFYMILLHLLFVYINNTFDDFPYISHCKQSAKISKIL